MTRYTLAFYFCFVPHSIYAVQGWGLGLNVKATDDDTVVTVGYYGSRAFIEAGANMFSSLCTTTRSKVFLTETRSHIGLRTWLDSKLSFDYGIHGTYAHRSVVTTTRTHPYTYGLFSGLSLKLHEHVWLGVRVSPYEFSNKWDRSVYHRHVASSSLHFVSLFKFI
ncbi:MAG: hypothetical protein VXY77_00015 [Pseudomonadota bacterium]|nr:hypothetical protein [Pseudomonadota bacterium]